jgi:uncharacterized protein (TIGR03437 family)
VLRYALCVLIPAVCLAQPSSYLITTVVGNGTGGYGGDGGAPASANLAGPIGIALDAAQNLYISDSGNNRIRKVSGGKITTYVGNGTKGYSGDAGAAASAMINAPYGIWVDAQGNLYIADLGNQVVRQVTPGGNINTIAGNNSLGPGFSGDGGTATAGQLSSPFGVVTDPSGNLYISDSGNNRIRIVSPIGTLNTFLGTNWTVTGCANQANANVTVQKPLGVTTDAAGNLYIADSQNQCIREVTGGNIQTVAGSGSSGSTGDGGPATSAKLNRPFATAIDSSGDIFIADYNNARIRMVTPDGNINTIAGGTGIGYTGDNTGIVATNARLDQPSSLAVDNAGHVYIADYGNNVIRMLTPMGPSVSSGGVVSAQAFGGFTSVAPGSWIEIYGSNLSIDRRPWGNADFQGSSAPTALDGTTVTIAGQPAYVDFISGGQVNVQVPSGVPSGSQQLVVKTAYGTSTSYTVNVNATQPGLLAPSNFKIGGVQYAAALFSDNTTYVLPTGTFSGVNSRPAKAGDIITIYGVGFGPASGATAGQIAPAGATLTAPAQFSIGGVAATTTFQGLSPGNVGLYQFNIVVPAIPAGTNALTFTLAGQSGSQTLYIVTQ